MPRFDPIQSNFTVGEIAPNVLGNSELEKYKQGLSKAENVIIEATGGVRRRGGFKYVAEVKYSSKDTILVEFQYKDEYSYIIEFGNLYMRFYRNQAQIVDGELTAIEEATTYTEAELRELNFAQDEEALYITHKNHKPAKLTRTSHIAWSLDDLTGLLTYDFDFTLEDAAQANDWRGICWSPELDLFCAVATDGTNRVMTSPDGETWTARTAAAASDWRCVCWSADLTLFCAVATNDVMTSPDGITWTTRTAATASVWFSVCWSPELTLFVAIASNDVMTSPDGITWTTRVSAAVVAWKSVCWSPELTLFVAVGTDEVMTSPDGVTWTSQTSQDGIWTNICWSPELLLFAAVGAPGDNEQIMTSPDGLVWTARTAPNNNNWISVCWSPELTAFCAIASAGVNSRLMVSVDGELWSERTLSEDSSNQFWAICWSPELLMFCAIAPVGDNRVIISTYDDYPSICWFFEQRFFLAATPEKPNKVWGSQSGEENYLNFDIGTGLDNHAISVVIKDAKSLLWATTSNTIILGASNGVFKLDANNLNEALTPTNVRPLRLTNYGSSDIPALDIAGSSIFIQKGLRKFRKLEYEYINNRYTAIDIAILSNHLAKSGLTELKYIDEPEPIIYGVRTDGELMGITYEPEFKIFGGFRHIVSGTDVAVKSIAVSDAIDDDQDELWAIISRTINGATAQYVEFLTPGLTAEDDIEDATFMDSFVTESGEAFTVINTLSHLEAETVQVFADGVVQSSQVVDKGTITITEAVKAHVGLGYDSTIDTLPLEGGNPIGSAMGKIKRIAKVIFRLLRSGDFKLSDLSGNTQETITLSDLPYTGLTDDLAFYGTHERDGQIRITINTPVPFNLLSIMYKAVTK